MEINTFFNFLTLSLLHELERLLAPASQQSLKEAHLEKDTIFDPIFFFMPYTTLMFQSFYRAYEEYQLLIFANKQGFYNAYFSFSSLDIPHNFLISTF